MEEGKKFLYDLINYPVYKKTKNMCYDDIFDEILLPYCVLLSGVACLYCKVDDYRGESDLQIKIISDDEPEYRSMNSLISDMKRIIDDGLLDSCSYSMNFMKFWHVLENIYAMLKTHGYVEKGSKGPLSEDYSIELQCPSQLMRYNIKLDNDISDNYEQIKDWIYDTYNSFKSIFNNNQNMNIYGEFGQPMLINLIDIVLISDKIIIIYSKISNNDKLQWCIDLKELSKIKLHGMNMHKENPFIYNFLD